jgi:hypothetical protein
MRINRGLMAGSLAGVATLTGLTGWFVSRRERSLDRRLAATAEKVRMLELRLDEADEELAVRLNEVDQEVEHLRPARGATERGSGPVG